MTRNNSSLLSGKQNHRVKTAESLHITNTEHFLHTTEPAIATESEPVSQHQVSYEKGKSRKKRVEVAFFASQILEGTTGASIGEPTRIIHRGKTIAAKDLEFYAPEVVDRIKDRLAKLEVSKMALEEAFSRNEEDRQQLRELLDGFHRREEELKKLLGILQSEKRLDHEKIQSLEKQLATLHADQKLLQSELTELDVDKTRHIGELQEEILLLQKTLHQNELSLEERDELVKNLRDQIDILSDQTEGLQDYSMVEDGEKQIFEAQLQSLNGENSFQAETIIDLVNQNEDKKVIIASLQEKLESAQAEIAALQSKSDRSPTVHRIEVGPENPLQSTATISELNKRIVQANKGSHRVEKRGGFIKIAGSGQEAKEKSDETEKKPQDTSIAKTQLPQDGQTTRQSEPLDLRIIEEKLGLRKKPEPLDLRIIEEKLGISKSRHTAPESDEVVQYLKKLEEEYKDNPEELAKIKGIFVHKDSIEFARIEGKNFLKRWNEYVNESTNEVLVYKNQTLFTWHEAKRRFNDKIPSDNQWQKFIDAIPGKSNGKHLENMMKILNIPFSGWWNYVHKGRDYSGNSNIPGEFGIWGGLWSSSSNQANTAVCVFFDKKSNNAGLCTNDCIGYRSVRLFADN